MAAMLCGAVAISGGPSIDLRGAAQRKEQRRREFEAAQVSCPKCGGEAWAELSPLTIWRDGVSRTVRMATCHAGCQRTAIKGGEVRVLGRARFEIPHTTDTEGDDEMNATDNTGDARSKVQAAVDNYGRGGLTAASLSVGLATPSGLCRWLKGGNGLAEEKVEGLLKWAEDPVKVVDQAQDTFDEAPLPVREPETKSRVEVEIHVDTAQAEESLSRLSQAFEKVDQEALLPVSVRIASPADLMLAAVAERGARAELERLGLDLPDGAKLAVSLEWCA